MNRTLVIDVGGTNIKLLATGRRDPIKIPSGPRMSARDMVRAVRAATADWRYTRVSIGYPGEVRNNKPARDPRNLGAGWVNFDFARAFGRPVRLINDAAMQALGCYRGGRMLFLGLGTGLGTALIVEGVVQPMEVQHLPYKSGRTYEDYLGRTGLARAGKRKWRRHVATVVALFMDALQVDYVVIGGGQAKLLGPPLPNVRHGSNRDAFTGGFRLWEPEALRSSAASKSVLSA
jgi:predicted NBD/HSP70 family sugar kinase